jgi:hypothetical protein
MQFKYILVFVFLAVAFASKSQTYSQTLSLKIADKLKDSLQLSERQKQALFQVNLQMEADKSEARRLYKLTDSLTKKIQRIENKRDSLYRPFMNEEQYQKYKSKKRSLISNN